MNHLPQISEAEFEVMKIVWKYAPINTNEITERLRLATTWSPKTIHTLIKRLVTKGALSYEKQGRIFVYTPLVGEKEYIEQESSSFLKRFYHGDLNTEYDRIYQWIYESVSAVQPFAVRNHWYILRHPQAFGQIVGRTFAVPPLAPPAHSFGGSFSATVFFSHPGRPDPHFSGNLIFHFRIAENQG